LDKLAEVEGRRGERSKWWRRKMMINAVALEEETGERRNKQKEIDHNKTEMKIEDNEIADELDDGGENAS
jgi:hypothetical protein